METAQQQRSTVRAFEGSSRGADPQQNRERVLSYTIEPELVSAILTWKNLVIRNASGEKVLLRGNGIINGGFWAIMGPSGGGKTTLLNTLACRLDPTCQVTGEFRLNGRKYTNTELKKMAGYVMQDNLLSAHLTVQETLEYTATLRLPELSLAERAARVDYVVKEMGLDHCRHIVVGENARKGISGGERKRLSVAQELLLKPSLLFLDEPTTGLDSATALDLAVKLRELSRTVCTVVCSIHQPQSKIFNMFDSLILVKAGQIIFYGSMKRAIKTFEEAGLPFPPMTNPADHVIDVLTPKQANEIQPMTKDEEGNNSDELPHKEESERLMEKFEEPDFEIDYGAEKPFLFTRGQATWLEQFYILTRRSFKELMRKRDILFVNLIQTTLIAVFIGTVFLQIGNDQKSITLRHSVLFFCVVNQGVFAPLSVVNSFPSERALSLRERASGSYYVSSYFIAKSIVDTFPQVFFTVLFCCIVYFIAGLRAGANHFFLFILFMVLCNLAATSIALVISAVCKTTDRSVAILPFVLEVSRLFGGFFLAPADLPDYFVWLDAISFFKYAFTGISLNEWKDLPLECAPDELKDGVCPTTNGNQFIETQGMDYISMGGCIGVLILFIIASRIGAYFAMKHLKH